MLVLANEMFNSPPVFAWVLPVLLFITAVPNTKLCALPTKARRKLFLLHHGHVFLFFFVPRRQKTMLKGEGHGQGQGQASGQGQG